MRFLIVPGVQTCALPIPGPPGLDPRRGAGPATMSQVSPGVQIVRNGETLMAQPGSALQVGDKIIVPADGSAKALFQGKDGQTLVGTFEGGTQADRKSVV